MISELEAKAQRTQTEWFINADRFPCVLSRETTVSDGEGGYTTTKIPLPAQTFRMVPLQDSLQERTDTAGRTVQPGYMLVGKYDADVLRGDTFTKDGRRYEIVFIQENRQYQTKAEVIYLG